MTQWTNTFLMLIAEDNLQVDIICIVIVNSVAENKIMFKNKTEPDYSLSTAVKSG